MEIHSMGARLLRNFEIQIVFTFKESIRENHCFSHVNGLLFNLFHRKSTLAEQIRTDLRYNLAIKGEEMDEIILLHMKMILNINDGRICNW
ncbi:uncharacterized protein LOC143373959 isoform X4 [Andrena cerasifolii]|uniref:uncharacterized protein LOC143373959 isoform X4 n=1 Tax=Andrena cerasifolii TaxID=2819439 RepID=UPI00403805E2